MAGCDKNKDKITYNDIPVIEGYLQAGGFTAVKIKHQVPFSSSTQVLGDVDSLTVQIYKNTNIMELKRADTGTYSDTNIVREGDTYTLKFIYNNKQVSATTTIPAKPTGYTQSATTMQIKKITSGSFPSGGFTQPSPVDLSWDNADRSYYMVVVKNVESNPELIFDTTGIGSPPSNVFRNQPTTKNSFSINSNQFQYFGKHQIILYHLNPDYAALYNTNGTSSQNLTTLSSGITNAEGIFTGITADTLFLQVNKK